MVSAFYDTVGCRLEPEGRATRFPAIMGDLYDGVLTAGRAEAALAELDEIERGLQALSPDRAMGSEKRGIAKTALEWCSRVRWSDKSVNASGERRRWAIG